ncbi:MAG: helix-turn-helix domain-containing protein [Crocinitomicaceae bacterium]|nr:helix-turn-helix domain-containing protein [Crocinitomicaceae bacterium]
MEIADIAKERQLGVGTIYTHCVRLIREEKIELQHVMSADRKNALSDVFDDYDGGSLGELKERVGNKFSWEELKLYQASLQVG